MVGTSGKHEHIRNTYTNVDDRKPLREKVYFETIRTVVKD